MVRRFNKAPPETLEDILKESLKVIDVEMDEGKIKLLLRLIISGIANHYFYKPDDLIDVGFLQFCKSPNKDELFRVNIIRNQESGVINAGTMWKYYTGQLKQEQDFKGILENFLQELINYSQEQEIDITKLTSRLHKKEEGD